MRRFYSAFFIMVFLLSCSAQSTFEPAPSSTKSVTQPEITKIPSVTNTDIPTQVTTPTSTVTPVPAQMIAVGNIRKIMDDYGYVYEDQLSYTYWRNIEIQIGLHGKAKRLTVFEYHGDEYNMYDGNYAMTQDQFREQMWYLVTNDYHFVTSPELVGFIEGWLDLPSRSVFLTSDSGYNSKPSLTRMMTLFDEIKEVSGVSPHFNSFIWTQSMDDPTSDNCKEFSCWDIYKIALDSGYFSFGSHTQSHDDFSTFSKRQTEKDLSRNIKAIQDGLGVTVYGIAWPLEVCSPFSQALIDLGFRFGFGGNTRGRSELFTYANDDMFLCLPRLFPPNPDGFSGRPRGQTLEQILLEAQN